MAQIPKKEEVKKSALSPNYWESIFNRYGSRIKKLANKNKIDIANLDSSLTRISFEPDSTGLKTEVITFCKNRASAIYFAEKLSRDAIWHELIKINPNWAKIDTHIVFYFIDNFKTPLIKRIKYRASDAVVAEYKIALNYRGNDGLANFLNQQFAALNGPKEVKFTGLILDARNYHVNPEPLITIYCGNKKIVSAENINRDRVMEMGMVLWSRQLVNDDVTARVGKNPLIIVPQKVINGNYYILDSKFFESLTMQYFVELLENCKIVIVI